MNPTLEQDTRRPAWVVSLIMQALPLILLWFVLVLQQWFTTVECGTFLKEFASLRSGISKGEIEQRFGKPDFVASFLKRRGDSYQLQEEEWYYMCSDEPFQLVMNSKGQFQGYQNVRSGVLNRPLYHLLLIHIIYLLGLALGVWCFQGSRTGRWSLLLFIASLVCMDVLMVLVELYPVSLWRFTFRWLLLISGMLWFTAAGTAIANLFLGSKGSHVGSQE